MIEQRLQAFAGKRHCLQSLASRMVSGIGAYEIVSVRIGLSGMLIVCVYENVRVGELVGTGTAMLAS
jgi:hypothetical protein